MADQPKKGVANVTRKTWDKAFFAQQAALRAAGGLEEEEKKTKRIDPAREEFQPAAEDAAGPAGSVRAFLKARTKKVELDSNVGKITVIKPDDAMRATGYFCEVCEVTLKDSVSYIDHVNGKKHLRKLGYSMRVEQSSVESVKDRLNAAAKRKWNPEISKKLDAVEAYEKKMAALEEEAQAKKAKKKEAKTPAPAMDVFASAEEEAMMAAMGFGGFHSTKKK
ncbi:hypothetical protein H310_13110 [Aphanomyces invadans]|uniref:U1-type domain-containing protein n=1 Tax=Aphanomyces invadans TaxID=157072 RepID=A0A024TF80_9STRA|nr:hypothetical protein H310_13110 [Aphanomyces invadans]ETV92669.1 hypothetical protein H310_13110 [Aphanomyces invadans]|eukprot:XP_008878705.1 hypothetical protein H310_13110 [Aphanomyces invadans]